MRFLEPRRRPLGAVTIVIWWISLNCTIRSFLAQAGVLNTATPLNTIHFGSIHRPQPPNVTSRIIKFLGAYTQLVCCLFRSLSVQLTGTEENHIALHKIAASLLQTEIYEATDSPARWLKFTPIAKSSLSSLDCVDRIKIRAWTVIYKPTLQFNTTKKSTVKLTKPLY